ncbi:MAG: transcriptional regulator [bacterium]|nr:transcriptional regulator [bacterium]MCY4271872.1 transcriptional regulator [bacterium]
MAQASSIGQSPTGASVGRYWDIEPPTRTINDVVDEVGNLRNRTKLLADDTSHLHWSADGLHSDALAIELQASTSQRAKENLSELLQELNSLGFSWRAIARIAQVSVPALRKWRMGLSATGENRRRVAEIVALCQMVFDKYLIEDVAGWLETPLLADAPITGLDLLARDRSDLVLRLACDYGENPEQILDDLEPGWRDQYASAVEVFAAPDGLPGTRLADQET